MRLWPPTPRPPKSFVPRSATTAATCSSAPALRCAQNGEAQDLFDSLGAKFKAAGLNDGELRVKRSRVGCFAACKGGPVMCVQPDGTWYYNVTPPTWTASSPSTWWAGSRAGAGVPPGAHRG